MGGNSNQVGGQPSSICLEVGSEANFSGLSERRYLNDFLAAALRDWLVTKFVLALPQEPEVARS